MKSPEPPDNEVERLAELKRLNILDTESEERFDQLTSLAQYTFGVEIVLVSLVDENRQWFKSCQNLNARETDRSISFCGHAINESQTLVVSDAQIDERFADNPLVTGPPYIRFYAGAQLRSPNGLALGTLCLIDSQPRQFDDQAHQHLRVLANQVERELYYDEWSEALKRQEKAQQHIFERERLLRTIIDNLPVNIYVKDLDHRKTLANLSEQHFVGAESEAELIGLKDEDIYPVYGDMLGSGELEDQRVTHQGEAIVNKETYAIDRRGIPTRFLVSKLPLYDGNNVISGLVGISIDVTKEKEAAEQTERQLLALRLLQEIGSEVGPDIGERMRRALRIGLDYLDMDIGIVSQIENSIYGIRWMQSTGELSFHEGHTLDLEDTYCQFLFENNGELVVEHMAESRYADHRVYKKHQLECYLAAFLSIDGKVVGTLSFSSAKPKSRPFDDGERLFMRLLCRWVAADLERQQTQQKLNDLVAQVPGMIYQYRRWIDGHSAFLYCSPGIADIFHLSAESALENIEPVFARIHANDLDRVNTSIEESALALSIWQGQFRVVDDNGNYRWVEGHGTPKRTIDGGTIWHGYILDIDERKKIEQIKSEFVSTVSHELRTPLTAIGGSLGLIAGGALGEMPTQIKHMIEVAQKNTDHLTLLINDLLDLEKLDAARIRLSVQSESLVALLQQSLEANAAYAERFGVFLVLAEGTADVHLLVDRNRFEQILSNLISNAVKFSASGKSVVVGWHFLDNAVELFVKDEGSGIPVPFRARAFERFTQADSSDRRSKGGTGLGLAISRELTELMSGKIWFESEEGVGTTFYVRFPLHSPPHGAIDSQVTEQE